MTTPRPEPQDPAPPPASARNTIFVGRFGLRAGWSALLYIALAIVFSIVFIVAALAIAGKLPGVLHDIRAHAPAPQSIPDITAHDAFIPRILQFAGLSLAALLLGRIERRRFSVYGIGRNRFADFLPGAFWGLATLSLLVAVLRATHHLVFDAQVLHGTAIYSFGFKWLLAFLSVGLLEEYLNRGFLQFTLTRGIFGLARKISHTHARAVAFTIAAFVMSILFSAGHLFNARENPMGIALTFVAAILFSYALWRTGSLWWAIGNHMAWDWAQSYLYGVPDSGQISAGRLFHTHPVGNPLLSGGIDGPEGSIFAIPILLLAVLAVRFTTKPGPQPPLQPTLDPTDEALPTPGFIALSSPAQDPAIQPGALDSHVS
jgi:membrane protease YdiL (CAAX protease family)